jgi:hypothetical protein
MGDYIEKAMALFLLLIACVIGALFALALGLMVALMWANSAKAHSAPTGWEYDYDCCSNKDCSELPSEAVQITDNGYVVTVTPDMNNQIKATRTYTIAYTATGLRESKDGEYHICLRPEYANNAGEIFGGGVICFYIPPQGY